ncbi:hypothetical protein [uncultured Roseobacter sp.]|uniref:hypothetical protein n=1 Tax=uncultured Roseobacter sp. TaxID=114847 RepID=UPI0026126EFD|nr:hypothetical protein [uncultured Roseobacter sp.]
MRRAADREGRAQRVALGGLLVLLLCYGGLKAGHIMLALEAYDGQAVEAPLLELRAK